MALVVQKFGGTSVGTLDRIRSVARQIAARSRAGDSLVVVVSAMGDHTDELLGMARELSPRPPLREVDMLLTAGERVSMSLLSIALHDLGIPSLSLTGSQSGILTDETHGNARIERILGDRIRQGVESGAVVIVAGFQGMSPKTREITTLGRGGSDLSAIALAVALNASSCEIYKDVNGVCSADPRIVPEARVLSRVGWAEMTELSWRGAGILHARGAHMAGKFRIPLTIRSSFDFDQPGTRVEDTPIMENVLVRAITHKSDMEMIRFSVGNAEDVWAKGLAWLWARAEAPVVTQSRALGGRVEMLQVLTSAHVDAYLREIDARDVERTRDIGAVTMVGHGFWQSPETLARACRALGDIPALLMESRDSAVTLCVPRKHVEQAVRLLHREFVESAST